MSDIDEHPDFASAQFEAEVNFALIDTFDRLMRGEELAMLWGGAIREEFLAATEGATPGEVRVVYEAIEAQEQARPRPGPRGFLGSA